MEEDIVHTIFKLDVIEGKSNVNLDELSNLLLDNYDRKGSLNPADSRYEDSYCPSSPLVDQVAEEVKESFKKYSGLHIDTAAYWGHIHEQNMSTNSHDHLDADVSSVLYVSVPEGSGNIVFYPTNKATDHYYWFPPEKRKILIFPSWLPHSVTRHTGDKPRVSLSLNFRES